MGVEISFDSFGDYFYETLYFKRIPTSKQIFMFRKVQLFGLRQVWNTEFGTEVGDI